jgi:DNA-directed DNA polymerase III PolC
MGGLSSKEAYIDRADKALLFAKDETAYLQERIRAKQIATSAAAMTGVKRQNTIQEAQDIHNFLDHITNISASDGLAKYVDSLHLEAHISWDEAWKKAQGIIERRQSVFGDRYYLETQIIPMTEQEIYNGYVRQLSDTYGIPCVVTADSHYLRQSDADLHRQMLRIRTEKRKPAKSGNKKEIPKVEFATDQANAIIASDGSVEELNNLYDDIITEQGACTGRKVRLDTKAYQERRKRWTQHAQIFYLQNQGDTEQPIAIADDVEDDSVSLDAIDPGRQFSDWMAEFWVRTPEEMRSAGALEHEMENTLKVAARCDIQIPVNNDTINPGGRIVHMPDFPLQTLNISLDTEGWNQNDYLTHLCREGLREYLEANPELDETKYASRLAYELKVICEAGFANYFLIVWDYINHIREIGGLTGPGRGSAAGSLATFVLGITKRIDPLKYGDLMFERFLTPGRPDLPDIDTDFDFASAARVYEYCQTRYGVNRVCKIGTFSKIGVRQALQDIGRVLGIPYLDVDKASAILKDFKPDDDQVIEDNKAVFDLNEVADLIVDLGKLRNKSKLHKQWFDYSNRLTGNRRNASQHASGVAIASSDLVELGIPLMASVTADKRTVVTTQYDMDDLTILGIPKFDQLKLSSLNTIAECEALIGDDFSIEEIPLNDEKTFKALSMGDNLSIFQVSQPKVRGVMRNVAPKTISDIAAIITVIRPGLFAVDQETGLTMEELYRARCTGHELTKYRFPFLEPILKSTKGVMLYQEQNLQICWAVGMDPLKADKLRKVLGKKKMSEAVKFEPDFIEGAMKNQGLTQAEAKELWDLIVEFAAYGFNAAHAYAYGLISYWTSYLKTHHPAEFMAATLSVQSQKSSKAAKLLIPKLLEDCGQMGRSMQVLAPDVNRSKVDFAIERNPGPDGLVEAIRFGLGGIKGLGALAQVIVDERISGPYKDFEDFDKRITAKWGKRPQKNALEALAYSGAFDKFFVHRSEAIHHIAMARASTKTQLRDLQVSGWKSARKAELDQAQAELCGNFYFVRENIEVLGREVDNFFEFQKNERLTIGGRAIEVKLDKKASSGKLYHRVILKTQWGDVSIDFFPGRVADPTQYMQNLKEKLFAGAVLIITGTVRDDRSMWGNSIALPKAEFRGQLKEDPIKLTKEAQAILMETSE